MRAVVTGAAGMLGSTLVPTLRSKGYEVYPTDIVTHDSTLHPLDITDFEKLLRYLKAVKPGVIVHLAAKTNLEACESDPESAYRINVVGTQNVALACRQVDATMVYLSTVGVFDGKKHEAYTEFDEPNPINIYGKSKWHGERCVERLLSKYFIVRTSWLVGGKEKDVKFVGMILRQIREGKKKLFAVHDKVGSPTYTKDLSSCLATLIKTPFYGIFHIANKGSASRYEIAQKVVEILGIKDIEVLPVSSHWFSKDYYAPRPCSEVLDNFMLKLRGMDTMRPWYEALEDYLQSSWSELFSDSVI